MDIYKAFGIQKDEKFPQGMNEEDYNTLRHHFDTHFKGNDAYILRYQPDTVLRHIKNPVDREDTWHLWINDYGPAYAQGKYGKNSGEFGSFVSPYALHEGLDESHRPSFEERFTDIKEIDPDNELDKMLRKAFGIRKDMPPEPLGQAFPQHELTMVECEDGQCLNNSTRSAMRNIDMHPHIIHGSHIDLEGPHSWVEFDHPEHGKIVFDPSSGLAGTPKDMYQDPAMEGKWGSPTTPILRLDAGWPTLIPEYRYSLRDYNLKTGEKEDALGFIDHPDHKISEEDRPFPSRFFFENKHPGRDRAMWETLRQWGHGVQSLEDHPGYAP